MKKLQLRKETVQLLEKGRMNIIVGGRRTGDGDSNNFGGCDDWTDDICSDPCETEEMYCDSDKDLDTNDPGCEEHPDHTRDPYCEDGGGAEDTLSCGLLTYCDCDFL